MASIGEVAARLTEMGLPHPLADACLAIANKIEALPPSQAQFLTLSNLDPSPHLKIADDDLIAALSFLCAAPESPLGSHGYVVVDGEIEVLDDEDFRHALRSGDLVNPLTGELETGGLRHVRLFYTLNTKSDPFGCDHHG
jgi:hypothetical protein